MPNGWVTCERCHRVIFEKDASYRDGDERPYCCFCVDAEELGMAPLPEPAREYDAVDALLDELEEGGEEE